MANINLLPWREAQRRERNRITMIMCAALLAAACMTVFAAKLVMDGRIQHQEQRNAYMQSEIDSLAKVIKEIDDLKNKRDALLARQEVIQNLQENRAQIVHVFDDLVSNLPKGVYYDSINKREGKLSIGGKAQSNARVSALMRSLDASDWFQNTSLQVVDVIDQDGSLVSKFDVDVREERKAQDESQGIEKIR